MIGMAPVVVAEAREEVAPASAALVAPVPSFFSEACASSGVLAAMSYTCPPAL